jgi:hypothetical protein
MVRRVCRQRRQAFREPRLRLRLVCGGERTEPTYFRGLKRHVRKPAVEIRVRSKGGSPKELVEYARSIAPIGADEFDEVWCVVDRDEFDLEPAVICATELDVRLAVSNPCFELWLLLHHEDCTAELGDAKSVLRRLAGRCLHTKRTSFGSPTLKRVWMTPCGVPNDSIQAVVIIDVTHRAGCGGWYFR